MLIRLNHKPAIDNIHKYPQSIVDRLSTLLTHGALGDADPRRKGFYDVTDGDRTFFIHISPVSGKVFLLASWQVEPALPLVARAASARSFECSAHLA
jgi:hypothetical protein